MRSRCSAIASPATEDLRAKALTTARVRFLRARRAVGAQELVARRIGASVDAVQLWERGKARIPAWALVLVEELSANALVAPAVRSHGSPSHEAARAPVVDGTQRAKRLSVRPNENGAPAVVSASKAQPVNLGDRSEGLSGDNRTATGSSPGDRTHFGQLGSAGSPAGNHGVVAPSGSVASPPAQPGCSDAVIDPLGLIVGEVAA